MRTQLIPWPSVLDSDGSVATARRPLGSSDIGEFAPYSGTIRVRSPRRGSTGLQILASRSGRFFLSLGAQIKAGLLLANLAARRASGC